MRGLDGTGLLPESRSSSGAGPICTNGNLGELPCTRGNELGDWQHYANKRVELMLRNSPDTGYFTQRKFRRVAPYHRN